MALSTGNAALWSDISAVYSSLRTVQSEHSLTQTALPSLQGSTILASTITTLNNAINALNSEKHLTVSTGVANPTVGALIKADIISTMKSKVDGLKGVCHFNFSQCSSFDFSFSCDGCPMFWNFSFSGGSKC